MFFKKKKKARETEFLKKCKHDEKQGKAVKMFQIKGS